MEDECQAPPSSWASCLPSDLFTDMLRVVLTGHGTVGWWERNWVAVRAACRDASTRMESLGLGPSEHEELYWGLAGEVPRETGGPEVAPGGGGAGTRPGGVARSSRPAEDWDAQARRREVESEGAARCVVTRASDGDKSRERRQAEEQRRLAELRRKPRNRPRKGYRKQ